MEMPVTSTQNFEKPSRSRRTLLNWILSRGMETLECRVERSADRYQVTLRAPGARNRAVVALGDALSAFQRHASLVAQLRGGGWTLEAYR
jgi:hypothetical protein